MSYRQFDVSPRYSHTLSCLSLISVAIALLSCKEILEGGPLSSRSAYGNVVNWRRGWCCGRNLRLPMYTILLSCWEKVPVKSHLKQPLYACAPFSFIILHISWPSRANFVKAARRTNSSLLDASLGRSHLEQVLELFQLARYFQVFSSAEGGNLARRVLLAWSCTVFSTA